MNKLYAKIKESLNSLYEYPYYFDDEQINKCLNTMLLIEDSVDINADKLAQKKQLKFSSAKELLLEQREDYPIFNQKLPVPNIFDIASRHNHWIGSADDEPHSSDIIRLHENFAKQNLNIALLDKDEFVEKVNKPNLYIQYWLDWLITTPSEGELLIKLVKSKIRTNFPDDIIVYTQLPDDSTAQKLASEIINKANKKKLVERVAFHSAKIKQFLYKEFKVSPDNPLISHAISMA